MTKRKQHPTVYLDTGDEVRLPVKFAVCPTCDGKGTRVNPNIDGNGLSQEDFDDDPDFREDYMAGVYDVQCDHCDGLRVIEVVDEDRADPKLLELYFDQEQEAAAEWASEAWLRRAESGERY